MPDQTTEGEFRVLESTRDREEWLLLDVESADPTYVASGGYGDEREGESTDEDGDDLAATVESLEAGNRVRAELEWTDERPRFTACEVLERTRFAFTRTREQLFEDARAAWNDARAAGEAMGVRLTRAQDGTPNGVVYAFADQPGQRDLFAEFRDGVKPLEPLLARLAEDADPPFEAFVVDNTDEPFLVVLLAMERGGLLASTVRETYFGESLFTPTEEFAADLDLEFEGGSDEV